MSSIAKKRALFDQQNAEAAAIVSANTERYPGLMQEWARAFLAARDGRPRRLLESEAA